MNVYEQEKRGRGGVKGCDGVGWGGGGGAQEVRDLSLKCLCM